MRKLTADEVKELAFEYSLGEKVDFLNATLVHNEESASGRWLSYHSVVLRDENGQHWCVEYSLGLTECQEHEFDAQVPFKVEPYEVVETKYRKVS